MMSTVRTWLEERFLTPVVVVAASAEADAVAAANGLDVVQLLRPFSVYHDNLFARIGEKNEVSVVRQFGVRLVRPECLREMDPKTRSEQFLQLMSEASDAEFGYGEQLDVALDAILQQSNMVEPKLDAATASILLQRSFPQWHATFVSDYVSMVRCSYFDALDHPVANVLVASSSTDAASIVAQLQAQEKRIKTPREGMPCMDEDVLTYVVVLHDTSNGPPLERVIQAFGSIQNQYTAQRCSLLRINSVTNPQDVARPIDCQRWLAANPPVECVATNGSGVRYRRVALSFGEFDNKMPMTTACRLNQSNVDEIQSVMNQFLSMALFPHLDRKLRALATSISEKRQSTLSKVAAWFRKEDAKPKAECWVPATDGGPSKYLFTSLEMQMRRAGDLCLALRDFESAANYYRMCRQELQSTLAQRDFNKYLIAAAQEGIALTQYFQGKLPLPSVSGKAGSGAQECRLETARDDYQRASVHSYSFRTALILFSFCRSKTPPANDRALSVLQQVLRTGVVSSNKVYSAIIHELCAMTCLFVNPPVPVHHHLDQPPPTVQDDYPVHCRLRQFARYLTIAGSAYMEIGRHQMALRCYLRAFRVYRHQGACSGKSRALVHEHMYTLIAHLYGKLSMPLKSIGFAATPVVDGTPAFSAHGKNFTPFWKRLRAVVDEAGFDECPHMVLPVVDLKSVALHAPRCQADDVTVLEESQLPSSTSEREWKVLEEGLRSHYHERTSFTVPKYYADGGPGRRGFAGSTLHRTATVPVGEVATLRLALVNPIGSAIVLDDLSVLVVDPLAAQRWADAAGPNQVPLVSIVTRVPCPSAQAIQLAPQSSTTLHLPLAITSEGEHTIIGLSWSVADVKGTYLFSNGHTRDAVEGVLERALSKQCPPLVLRHEAHLHIHAVAPQAFLKPELIPPLPSAMRDGEVYRGVLRLTNHGQVVATHVVLQRSPANAHLTYFADFREEENELTTVDRPMVVKGHIEPGASMDIQLILRAQHGGGPSMRAINNIPVLIGYAPHTGAQGASPLASPVVASPVVPLYSPAAASPFTQHVRMCRILRRVVVRPSLDVRVHTSVAKGATLMSVQITNLIHHHDLPLHVSRVGAVLPRCSSSLEVLSKNHLLEEDASGCVLLAHQALILACRMTQQAATTATEPLQHTTRLALALSESVRSSTKAATLQAMLPGAVESDPVARYFATLASAGPGTLGEYMDRDTGDFSFYLDKAGGKTAEELAEAQAAQDEHRHYGGRLVQYPPLCCTVGWFAEDGDGQTVVGEHYVLVDVASQLIAKHVAGLIRKGSISAGNIATPIALPQEALGQAFRLLRTPAALASRAVVAYSAQLPARCVAPAHRSRVAVCPVAITLQSWSPLPLRVSIVAQPTSCHSAAGVGNEATATGCASGMWATYVGKTKANVVLLPNEAVALTFSAECYTSGLVNLNTFDVSVSACRFGPHTRRTGMPPPRAGSANDALAHRFVGPVVVIGGGEPWMTQITIPPPVAADDAAAHHPPLPHRGTAHVDPSAAPPLLPVAVAARRVRGMSMLNDKVYSSPVASTTHGGVASAATRVSVFPEQKKQGADASTDSAARSPPPSQSNPMLQGGVDNDAHMHSPSPKMPLGHTLGGSHGELPLVPSAGVTLEGALLADPLADVDLVAPIEGTPMNDVDETVVPAEGGAQGEAACDGPRPENDATDSGDPSAHPSNVSFGTTGGVVSNASLCHVPDVAERLGGGGTAAEPVCSSSDDDESPTPGALPGATDDGPV